MNSQRLAVSFYVAALAGISSLSLYPSLAFGQNEIVPDNTLGEESSRIEQMGEGSDRIEGGALRDSNLFHSFQEFNIEEGLSAYFANPSNAENIFSRVTGNNASRIFGTLGVEGSANLFFLNPNGIIFGPDAQLDIAGSLTLSTASAFEFADSSQFSSRPLTSSPLTISVPTGLQAGTAAGNIESSGALNVGGNITLVADRIELQRERIEAGRDIQIVSNHLEGTQGAQLRTNATGGGNIAVDVTDTVTFDGINEEIEESSGIFSIVASGSEGSSGDIRLSANRLELTDGAQIGSGTFGIGDAGNIAIDVEQTVRFDGNNLGTRLASGVFSNIEDGGQGEGGNIEIKASNLELLNGAQLVSGAIGGGNAGNILIQVSETARFSGSGIAIEDSEILEETSDDSDVLSGEDVSATTPLEDIEIAEELPANESLASSDLDNMISLDEPEISPEASGPTSSSELPESDGVFFGVNALIPSRATGAYSLVANESDDGGDIRVQATHLSVEDGARLNASTLGEGDAGDISIEVAETALLGTEVAEDDALFPGVSGLSSDASSTSGGRGGDIAVTANNLELLNASELRAASRGTGDAGNIKIEVDRQINADFGNIRTVSEAGTGGNISIRAEDIRLRNNSNIATFVATGTGSGGDITIVADSILAFGDSDILSFSVEGNGGNIFIDSPVLLTQDDPLSGDRLSPSEILDNGKVDINASGRVSGIISIPEAVAVEAVQRNLPEGFENAIVIAASSCVSPAANPNRFVISGRGGVPTPVGSGLSLPYITGEVRSLSSEENPISLQQQYVSKLTAAGLAIGQACSQ